MANQYTGNYNLVKPEVGAATNTWGGLLNTNFDTIDTQIKSRQTEASTAQATADAALPKAGGTMTGFITLHANPTSNYHPATKQYVDAFLSKAGGTMTGYITLHAAPTDIFHPANKKYVDDAVANAQIQAGAGLPITGGTMLGYLTLSGAPTSSLHAATKQYVDDMGNAGAAVLSGKLAKAGDTMTGPLVLAADPTSNSDIKTATTKNYVDTNFLAKAGGTMTGPITLSADPSASMHPVTLNYFTANAFTKAGGSMTGMLSLFADPSSAMHPVTKQYFDQNAFSKTQSASQQMAGPLVLYADPTGLSSGLQAATKNYVDTQTIPRSGTGGSPMTGYLALVGDPQSYNHAATKQYVDNGTYLDADLKAIAAIAGTGYLKRLGEGSWTLDTSAGVQSITVTGDVTGSGSSSLNLTLANSGVVQGTYNDSATAVRPFTVDAKGRITSIGTAVNIAPDWNNIANKPAAVNDILTATNAASTYLAKASPSFTGSLSGGTCSMSASTGAISGTSLSVGTGAITCGTLTASSDITLSSDVRIKEDIRTINDALDLVTQLRGVSYIRKDTKKSSIGVIAQEVEQIIPSLVYTDDAGMKSVAYANMVGVLIEAVKELSNRVKELEAR